MARRRPPLISLKDLRSESRALADEIAALREALAAVVSKKETVDAVISAYDGRTSAATAPRKTRSAPASQPMPADSPYYGKAFPEAAMQRLSLAAKPESAREIWAALSAASFPSDSKDPVHAVHWALRRRAEKHGDVLLVGVGKWGLRDWYSDEQIEEITRNLGGMGGRDREAHVEKTRQGIANLKARGVRWGRPSTIDAEKMAIFKAHRKEGKSINASAKAAGFSGANYQYFRNKYDDDAWEPGDPWPPPLRKDDQGEKRTGVQLRVVGQN